MKYYIAINGQQAGPFEESELVQNGLTPTSLVWTEGMSEWKPAQEVPALKYLFGGSVPPQFGSSIPNNNGFMPQPKTWLAESILATIFCCLPFGIVGIIKAANVSTLYNQGRYEEAQMRSEEAKKWTIIAAISGIVYLVIYSIILAAGVFSGLNDLGY